VRRKPWYAVPCCPSNISRTWADLGRYIYSATANSLTIHQLIGSALQVELAGTPISVEMTSSLPWVGKVSIRLQPETPVEFALSVRIPSWAAETAHLAINQQPMELYPLPARYKPTACGYDPRLSRLAALRRRWSAGDEITLSMDMPITLQRADPKVKGHAGKAALTRGPLVYCLESVDNPGVDIFNDRLSPESLTVEHEPDLLGGISVLRGETVMGTTVIAIPYHLWGNRGESQMNVWVNI